MGGSIAIAALNVLNVAAKWVPIAYIAFCAKDAVIALAGQKTEANFIVAYLTDSGSGMPVTVFTVIAIGTTIWAVTERILRQRAIARLTARTTQLETIIDEHRSSSGLTADGQTHPRDR